MPRPKSFSTLTAKELQDLREQLEAENARRQLLSVGNEAIKGCVESIRTVARNLKVEDHDIAEVIVSGLLDEDYAIYLKRGRKAPAKKKAKK